LSFTRCTSSTSDGDDRFLLEPVVARCGLARNQSPLYNAGTSKNPIMELLCKHCGARLSSAPDRAEGDWYIPCFRCGVKNVIAAVIHVIGWRT